MLTLAQTGGILAGAAASPFIGTIPQAILSRAYGFSIASWKLDEQYYAWSLDPNQLPSPEILFDLYLRGFIDEDKFKWAINRHGINHGPFGANHKRGWYWDKYLQSVYDAPTVDSTILRYRTGELTLDDAMAKLALAGSFSVEGRNKILTENETLPIELILSMFNRGLMSKEYLTRELKKQGFGQYGLAEQLFEMRKYIPSVPDLVQFAVREVWDLETVKEFGYDEEFPEPLRYWSAKMGADWSESFQGNDGKEYPFIPWPKAYWRAHWQVISPGQAYEMFHRLRKGRIDRLGPGFQDVTPFTLDDVKRVLKVADYPRKFREGLAAIAYAQPQARTVARLYRAGVVDRQELKEKYKDRGFTDQDAEEMTQLAERELQAAAWKTVSVDTKNKILEGYKIGTIDKDTAAINLYRLMLTNPVALAQFQAMDKATQRGVAMGNGFVVWALAEIDEGIRSSTAKVGIGGIRKRYLAGLTDEGAARRDLGILGIFPGRIDDYLMVWNLDKVGRRREASAGQLADWFRRGLVGYDQADEGLKELGYTPFTRGKILARAQQRLEEDVVKIAVKNAKDVQSLARAQDRLLRRQHSDLRRTQREALEHASETKMGKWLAVGLITANQMLARLLAGGYSQEDARRSVAFYLTKQTDQAEKQRDKVLAKDRPRKAKDSEPRLSRWYKRGIIDKKEYETRLSALGFSAEDVHNFEKENTKKKGA